MGVRADTSIALFDRSLDGACATCGPRPYLAPDGVIVAFDGRLDETDSLAKELGAPAPAPAAAREAALVAAAYARWGVRAFARLIGEWSIALFDPSRRMVLLAVDFSGAFPLYYSVTPAYAWWASELAVFAASDHGRRADAKYLLGFMLGLPELGHAPFDRVKAVLPGTCVAIADGQARSEVIWAPDLTARLRCKDDRDYEVQFRDVFFRVIRDRLSKPSPVWSELSGGLDSSSIVCVADELAKTEGFGADKLCAVYYRFHGGSADEDWHAVQEVVRATNVRTVVVESHKLPYLSDASCASALPSCVGGVIPEVARLMADAGTRVLLSGEGGDGLMCDGRGWPCALLGESLREGRVSRAFAEARAFSRWTGRSVWDLVWNDVVRARRWKRPDLFAPKPLPWLYAKDIDAYREWTRGYRSVPRLSECSSSSALTWQYIDLARRCVAAQPDRLTGAIDVSYPYLDRRLVQFMLSVPFHQKLRPGTGRWLQRRALEGVLPEAVRTRKGKSTGRGPLIRALDAEWRRIDRLLQPDAKLAEARLIDIAALREAASGARSGRTANLGAIWRTLALEQWLRTNNATVVS